MKKYILTSLFVLTLGAMTAEGAKQTLSTVGETTHGDVRTTVNTNATKSNSNFTELYNRKQTGVTDWTTNGAGYTYAEDDLVKYGDKIYIALGAHVQDVETPDTSEDFAEWAGGGSGAVSSVNTQTGDVVLDADDISDTTTTNKFVTSAEKTKLSNLSGTNTGDQDLSSLATKANVLQLNNTTAFTPDADYEPATKKYVDDAVVSGGGYTDEQAQDAVGGMFSGNTETGITVTYDDASNKVNFAVASQTDNNFTTAYKNKLDGIAESADVDTDDQTASEVSVSVTNFGNNLSAADNTVQKALDTLDNISIGGSYTDEQAQDAVGAMVSGNTETGIAVTYDDATAKLNFVLDDDLVDLSDGAISASKVTPPGSNTQLIFNNASAFAGDTGLTYDAATDALTVSGSITTPSFILGGNDGSKKLVLARNTSITATAGEESIYNEADQVKVTESGIEYDVLNSGDIGVTVQAYNQYLPVWPSSVNNTEVSYLDGVTSSIQTQLTGKEASLGNPSVNGYVLSSTTTGTRSWIAAGGMVYPGDGIPVASSGTWGSSLSLVTTVGATGTDTSIPSEQAVREAINALPTITWGTGLTDTSNTISVTYPVTAEAWSGSGWNADTGGLQRNDAYDYLHIADTDDDGLPNKVDMSDGLAKVTSNVLGVASEGTDYLAGARIDDTKGNGDTTYIWSADKVYDQLDLKAPLTSAQLTTPVIVDGSTLTFDESADDPNDADIQLSATDGVFKIAAVNGANNEDLTIDLDAAANKAKFNSGSGLTLITTGSIPFTGAIRTVGKGSDYTIGTDDADEAYGSFFVNTGASTRTFTLPSAVAGMSVCVRNGQGVSQILRLDANTGDYIVKSTGARTSASAEYYGATADAKNQLCVVAYDSTDWYVTSEVGTWSEE